MQRVFLRLVFVWSLLFVPIICANQVDSDAYLLNWLKNSEHYVQERVASKESPDTIVLTPAQSAQAAQNIVSVLCLLRKQDVKGVQQETITALEASNLIACKGGLTQKTALAKLCQHSKATLLGKISLADMLVRTAPDLSVIRSRQEIIQALCDNDALRETLVSLRNAYAQSSDSMHMFKNARLSGMGIPLEAINIKILGKTLITIPETGIRLSLAANGSAYALERRLVETLIWGLVGNCAAEMFRKQDINYSIIPRSVIGSLISEAVGRSIFSGPSSIVYDLYKKYTQPNKDIVSCLAFCSYNRHIIDFCRQLGDLSQQCSQIKNITSLSCLHDFEQKIKEDSGFKRFVDLLNKEPSRLWQYEQRALITLANKYQHELVGLYKIAGEAEAYLAVAQTKKYFDNHDRLKMVFTEFTNSGDTKLHMRDFWNPSLDDEKAVPNSLTFNDAEKNHKILTGSNMGGKSTLIKGIIANVMLSQTFGVACAQEWKQKLVDELFVSLNITDDTGKESLFEAEINRAAGLLEALRTNPDKNSLVACDELFVGTGAPDAGLAAKTVAQEIAKANAISIFATHHGKVVTDLGVAAQTPFTNIKMDAVEDEQVHTVYTYQCKEGVSQERVARKLFEQRIGVPMATE